VKNFVQAQYSLHATQQVKQAAWEMLGAIDELRAKPIWSAAQHAQLAALSERLRTATVAGETEHLRELLPQASGEVNALILAAQTAAQRRAAAAPLASPTLSSPASPHPQCAQATRLRPSPTRSTPTAYA